jgi:hypothetical protein
MQTKSIHIFDLWYGSKNRRKIKCFHRKLMCVIAKLFKCERPEVPKYFASQSWIIEFPLKATAAETIIQ